MRIRLAQQARADLDTIWLYIARESGNSDSATRAVGSITEKFGLFAKFPHIGRSLESDLRPNVRSFPVNSYVIFYSVKPGEIRILRIIHASRDAQAAFTEEF
jgi:toxin ParE1/3/4